jgi:heme-degrading monooxygenase HmoA
MERSGTVFTSSLLQFQQPVPITEEHKKSFDKAYETLAGRGERILGFAQLKLRKKCPSEDKFPMVVFLLLFV